MSLSTHSGTSKSYSPSNNTPLDLQNHPTRPDFDPCSTQLRRPNHNFMIFFYSMQSTSSGTSKFKFSIKFRPCNNNANLTHWINILILRSGFPWYKSIHISYTRTVNMVVSRLLLDEGVVMYRTRLVHPMPTYTTLDAQVRTDSSQRAMLIICARSSYSVVWTGLRLANKQARVYAPPWAI
jgi:hypothetical protein